jgi:single-strand DNA-binding protein
MSQSFNFLVSTRKKCYNYSTIYRGKAMAGSINKVTLLGNLGADPEVRMGQDGSKIVTFSVATSEFWSDKQSGERKEKTEWHRVVIFNDRLAEVAEKYLRKGSKVYLEGQLQTRQWKDNSGVDRYTTETVISRFKGELVLIDSRNNGGGESFGSDNGFSAPTNGGTQSTQSFKSSNQSSQAKNNFGIDDEIPF